MSLATVMAVLTLTKTVYDLVDRIFTVYTKDFSGENIAGLKKNLDAIELVLENPDLKLTADQIEKLKKLKLDIETHLELINEIPDGTLLLWRNQLKYFVDSITEKHLAEVKKTVEDVAAQYKAKIGAVK